MVVGNLATRTEVAVIGSGPGGYVAALRAADAGREVTLIERDQLGGVCLNVGCIPSKSLIETACLVDRVTNAEGSGVSASVTLSMPQVQHHLAATSARLRSGVASLLADAGVSVVSGIAHFTRWDRLAISRGDEITHLEFDHAIVATGSRPIELAELPFGPGTIDSTQALRLTTLPTAMTVVGGGYIGVELGTAFAKLGSSVTIIEAGPTILGHLDPSLRSPIEARLIQLGVRVRCGVQALPRSSAGVELSTGEVIESDVTVVAVGRRPNSDTCALDQVGASFDDRGFVDVDDHLQAAPRIYAIGDLIAGPAFAHRASADAERAVHHLVQGEAHGTPVQAGVVPTLVFSDPEVISVGTTIGQGTAHGWSTHRFTHRANGRAHTLGSSDGATFVVVDEAGTVRGIHAVGPHVSELAGEAALAVEMAATIEDLSMTVHAHPTVAETLAEAAWLARGLPLHVRS